MNALKIPDPTDPDVIPFDNKGKSARYMPRKRVLGLAKLISTESLSPLCSVPFSFGGDIDPDRHVNLFVKPATIVRECKNFCTSFRSGIDYPQPPYDLSLLSFEVVRNPLPFRVVTVWRLFWPAR